jgi:hypothetical protein
VGLGAAARTAGWRHGGAALVNLIEADRIARVGGARPRLERVATPRKPPARALNCYGPCFPNASLANSGKQVPSGKPAVRAHLGEAARGTR